MLLYRNIITTACYDAPRWTPRLTLQISTQCVVITCCFVIVLNVKSAHDHSGLPTKSTLWRHLATSSSASSRTQLKTSRDQLITRMNCNLMTCVNPKRSENGLNKVMLASNITQRCIMLLDVHHHTVPHCAAKIILGVCACTSAKNHLQSRFHNY